MSNIQRRKSYDKSIRERESGPDWFRELVKGPRNVDAARSAALEIQEQDVGAGSARKPWFFQGWKGWATDSVRWGIKDLSLIWESSGEQTHSTLTRMPRSLGLAKRIDIHSTLTFSIAQDTFGASCLWLKTPTSIPQKLRGRPVGVSSSTSGSWCGTVGNRTSPKYWRVYDKGVESGKAPPGVKWRVELEAKGAHAEELGRCHREDLLDPHFCNRYLISSWEQAGCCWPITESESAVDVVVTKKPEQPPAWRLKLWMENSVRPTMPRMLNAFSVADVLETLGLSGVASPIETRDA